MKLSDLVEERRLAAVEVARLDAEISLALADRHQVVQQDNLLTAGQAAKRLGISRVFLYEKARHGEVKSVRIGRSVRFRTEDLT